MAKHRRNQVVPVVESLDRRELLSTGLTGGLVHVEATHGAKSHAVSGGGTATGIDFAPTPGAYTYTVGFQGSATPIGAFGGTVNFVFHTAALTDQGKGSGSFTADGGTLNFTTSEKRVSTSTFKGTLTAHGGTGVFAKATGKLTLSVVFPSSTAIQGPFTLKGSLRY